MSYKVFKEVVFTKLVVGIYDIIRRYSVSYYGNNDSHHDMGVYLYTTRTPYIYQTVHIIFHAPNGGQEARNFITSVYTELENLCTSILARKFCCYHILTGSINWSADCFIGTACESLHPDGVIIRCTDTLDKGIISVVDGVADRT